MDKTGKIEARRDCGCVARWIRGRLQVVRCAQHEREKYERELTRSAS